VYAESDALHARVRAFIDGSMGAGPTEPFETLATDIARLQMRRVAPVARLARARGLSPEGPLDVASIPAVPTDVFRFARVAAHPPEADVAVFRTSGTTSGARGEHAFRTLATYDAAASAWGSRCLLEGRTDLSVISLTPPPEEAVGSSLVHMIALFSRAQAGPVTWHLAGGSLDPASVERACEAARAEGRAALLTGTSFAFVHLLDAPSGKALRLPPGSRAMLTGGFKGRSREVPASELRAEIASAFALPDAAIVGEYGMTELSSQLYEATLARTHARHEVYTPPPWVRVTAVDPETLSEVPPGEIGIARIVDLANVDSAIAILTADRVRVTAEGAQLLGRLPGATPRGCSLAAEEALG
jgi:acyl-CoA synthetase (AMP-forming)/AMP-acid ligase II